MTDRFNSLLKEKLLAYRSNVLIDALLFIITLGFYSFIWQRRKIGFVNTLRTEEEFTCSKWINLTLQTCGVYHFYHQITIGRTIRQILRMHGINGTEESSSVLDWVMCIISAGLINDIIHQRDINVLVEKPSREIEPKPD
ncbi:MAG: DUF4234 domain-containing protein [Candidatus Dadabacteria bacterium]|nr:DUF4234 domain-containing protein [Candidatus Dadabacteria bacterium]